MTRLWTSQELADRYQLSKRTIFKMVKAGDLPSIKIGRLVRFDPEATDAAIQRMPSASRESQQAPAA